LIPKFQSRKSLEENIGATDVKMTAEDLSEIDAAASQLSVKGERLPKPVLRMTGL
jgi:diketogulonate reductase-like aldo/keto reductase